MIGLSKGQYVVYCLSFPNGKEYIGVTMDLKRRLKEHGRANALIGRAIRKYGPPVLRVLALCEEDYAYELEYRAVRGFDTLVPAGYNLMDGGMGGRKMSVATRQKMSASHTGLVMPEEHSRKLSERQQGLRHSEEHRNKIAESLRGRQHSLETKQKMSKSRAGIKLGPMSEETKRKISETKRGVKLGPKSEDHRRKLSESQRLNHIRRVEQ